MNDTHFTNGWWFFIISFQTILLVMPSAARAQNALFDSIESTKLDNVSFFSVCLFVWCVSSPGSFARSLARTCLCPLNRMQSPSEIFSVDLLIIYLFLLLLLIIALLTNSLCWLSFKWKWFAISVWTKKKQQTNKCSLSSANEHCEHFEWQKKTRRVPVVIRRWWGKSIVKLHPFACHTKLHYQAYSN